MAKPTPSETRTHELKVTLVGIKPLIWRSLLVRSTTTLFELHGIIQLAFGWTNSHMHEFRGRRKVAGSRRDVRYGDPADDAEDEFTARVCDALPVTRSRLSYVYDFGDHWEHEIRVEKTGAAAAPLPHARCLAGARAGPLEDCGGPWGFMDVLKSLKNPRHPEHEERVEWLGDDFDPEEFDLEAIDAALRGSHHGRRRDR